MPVLPLVGSTTTPPGPRQTLALGLLDHREADPVLHRAAGVGALELAEHAASRGVAFDASDLDERCVADELEDVLVDRRVIGQGRKRHGAGQMT